MTSLADTHRPDPAPALTSPAPETQRLAAQAQFTRELLALHDKGASFPALVAHLRDYAKCCYAQGADEALRRVTRTHPLAEQDRDALIGATVVDD